MFSRFGGTSWNNQRSWLKISTFHLPSDFEESRVLKSSSFRRKIPWKIPGDHGSPLSLAPISVIVSDSLESDSNVPQPQLQQLRMDQFPDTSNKKYTNGNKQLLQRTRIGLAVSYLWVPWESPKTLRKDVSFSPTASCTSFGGIFRICRNPPDLSLLAFYNKVYWLPKWECFNYKMSNLNTSDQSHEYLNTKQSFEAKTLPNIIIKYHF